MTIEVHLVGPGDARPLDRVAADVFDNPLDEAETKAFLEDPNHRLAIAIADGLVVGFLPAVRYHHPDKPKPDLWINEGALAPSQFRQGLGTRLMRLVLDDAKHSGCSETWVLADASNEATIAFYRSLGPSHEAAPQIMVTYDLED